MNGIVLDASVAIALVTQEASSGAAVRETASQRVMVPDVFWCEVARALCRKVRQGRLQRGDALRAVELLRTFVERTVPTRHLAVLVTEMALDLDHDAFDCTYVAVAMEHDTLLLTADRALHRKVAAAGLGDRVRLVVPE